MKLSAVTLFSRRQERDYPEYLINLSCLSNITWYLPDISMANKIVMPTMHVSQFPSTYDRRTSKYTKINAPCRRPAYRKIFLSLISSLSAMSIVYLRPVETKHHSGNLAWVGLHLLAGHGR